MGFPIDYTTSIICGDTHIYWYYVHIYLCNSDLAHSHTHLPKRLLSTPKSLSQLYLITKNPCKPTQLISSMDFGT